MRATLIRPKAPPLTKKGEWLETALKQDPLLKALPNWARDKAIDGLKDIDETIAEKIIDALPWESGTKEAATAALKALLQTAKGKKFEMPVAPPNPRLPDWTKPQDFQAAPGQVIIQGPADQVVRPLVVVRGPPAARGSRRRGTCDECTLAYVAPARIARSSSPYSPGLDALAGRADHVGRLDRALTVPAWSGRGKPACPPGPFAEVAAQERADPAGRARSPKWMWDWVTSPSSWP